MRRHCFTNFLKNNNNKIFNLKSNFCKRADQPFEILYFTKKESGIKLLTDFRKEFYTIRTIESDPKTKFFHAQIQNLQKPNETYYLQNHVDQPNLIALVTEEQKAVFLKNYLVVQNDNYIHILNRNHKLCYEWIRDSFGKFKIGDSSQLILPYQEQRTTNVYYLDLANETQLEISTKFYENNPDNVPLAISIPYVLYIREIFDQKTIVSSYFPKSKKTTSRSKVVSPKITKAKKNDSDITKAINTVHTQAQELKNLQEKKPVSNTIGDFIVDCFVLYIGLCLAIMIGGVEPLFGIIVFVAFVFLFFKN